MALEADEVHIWWWPVVAAGHAGDDSWTVLYDSAPNGTDRRSDPENGRPGFLYITVGADDDPSKVADELATFVKNEYREQIVRAVEAARASLTV